MQDTSPIGFFKNLREIRVKTEPGVKIEPGTGPQIPAPPLVGTALQLTRADEVARIFDRLRSSKMGDPNTSIAAYILSNDMAPALTLPPTRVLEEEIDEDEDVERVLISKIARTVDPRVFQFVQTLINNSPSISTRNEPSEDKVRIAVQTAGFISTCSRRWNATMLSSPQGYERPCGFGTDCLALKKHGKALKEFFTHLEMSEIEKKGRRAVSVETRACLMCVRDTLARTHLYHAVHGDAHTLAMFPQPFKNSVDVAGEYQSADCIPLLTSFSMPIVMNIEHGYTVSWDRDTQVMTLSETGYAYPAVFE